MLLRCIKAENKKLKGSHIWLAFFLIPILPAVMGTFNYLGNLGVLKSGWYSLWTQHTLFYANFFYGPLIGIYCSYLWRLEHLNGNWNQIMTAPVPRSYIYLAKFLKAFKMTLLTQCWVGVLFFLCGKYAGLPGFLPGDMIGWLLRGCFGGVAVIGLQLTMSMIIRSFSIPIAIALGGSIAGMMFINAGFGLAWPYSIMALAMNSNQSSDVLNEGLLLFSGAALFFTFLFISAGILTLKGKDVRTA